MNPEPPPRSMTGKLTLASMVAGGCLALVLHLAVGKAFSWWFVVGGAFAAFFATAVHVRRHRWQERSASAALATLALALPLLGKSFLFLLCSSPATTGSS
jgi:hypothetical protein